MNFLKGGVCAPGIILLNNMQAKYTILGGFNRYPGIDFDAEDLVNLFLIRDKEGKKMLGLLNTPGLELAVQISPGSAEPTRNLWVFNGRMYGVFGAEVYEFSDNLVPNYIGSLETNRGYVDIENNNGGQIIFIDGVAGYIFVPATGSFTKITDPDFPVKPINVAYLDTYFVIPSAESQTFQISANNDGSAWNGFLDSAQVQTYPGVNKGVGVVNQRLYFFKDTSTEVWWDPGDADFPLRKDTNLNFNFGCLAPDTIDSEYGYLCWLSQDKSGAASIMMSTGYVPQKISTEAIESTIAAFRDPADAQAYIYKDEGRVFYVISWTTDDFTLVCNLETLDWHRMEMLKKPAVAGDENSGKTRHISSCHAYFNGVHYVGSYKEPTLYAFSRDFKDNAGEPILQTRIGKTYFDPMYQRMQGYMYQLDIQPGIGNVVGDYTDPKVLLSVSKDGGHAYNNREEGRIGRIGQRQTRCLWRKKGLFRNWTPKIEIRDSVGPICIMGDCLQHTVLPK